VRAALQFAPTAPPIHARKRIRGSPSSPPISTWRRGTGPAVEGPARP
jgi:hypothetical protein